MSTILRYDSKKGQWYDQFGRYFIDDMSKLNKQQALKRIGHIAKPNITPEMAKEIIRKAISEAGALPLDCQQLKAVSKIVISNLT